MNQYIPKPCHLTYHYLNKPGEEIGGSSCDISRFRKQIEWLKENGYEFLSLSEVAQRMKNNQLFPEKLATLSFDDGLRDGYASAYPILKEFGIPGSFLITTCVLENKLPSVIAFQILIKELGAEKLEFDLLPRVLKGTPYATLLDSNRYNIGDAKARDTKENRRIKWVFNHFLPTSLKVDIIDELFESTLGVDAQVKFCRELFMSGEEMREMAQNGMDFLSHTVTHPPLNICGLGDVDVEARDSQKALENLLEKPIRIFGWPFGGEFKQSVKDVVARYYDGAFNFVLAKKMPECPYNDIYDIPRLDQQYMKF
ncbi:MAG: polysaccharide deacetylase family protein [Patescibacteria group bacterium]|nr:polysaccharide deacetylase family protein [Patescibacteria group bacterium]